ncbi:hypothetical protein [Asaia bogorensis]|uniref:hypothetical protein n=1 Tax=Asaia bogorensis TaxID=91915 RepID=UPI0038CF4F62
MRHAGDSPRPTIGYDTASKVAHHAMDHDCTLKEAALALNTVSKADVRPTCGHVPCRHRI